MGLFDQIGNPSSSSPTSLSVPGITGTIAGQVNNLLGLVGLGKGVGSPSPDAAFPDQGSPSGAPTISDDFFVNWVLMDHESLADFNKIYSYEFVITQTTDKGSTKVISRIPLTLPPSSISMNVPTAVNLRVTHNGILEQSNGAPLRNLSIAGTTGVINADLIGKQQSNVISNVLDYAFKNTLQAVSGALSAVQNVVNQVQNVIGTLGGDVQAGYPLNTDISAGSNPGVLLNTGYYMFHNLARFFDYYLAVKKTADGRQYRLHFNMYKDKMYYDVTLTNFSWQKRAGTVEYDYSIALTAWRMRKEPAGNRSLGAQLQLPNASSDPLSAISSSLKGLIAARQVLGNTTANILRGVQADANNVDTKVLEPLRELISFNKTATGTQQTVLDILPATVQQGTGSILTAIGNLQSTNPNLASSIDTAVQQSGLIGDPNALGNAGVSGLSSLADQINNQAAYSSSSAVNGPETSYGAERMFKDPISYAAVFDQVNVSDVQFNQAVNSAIQQENLRIGNLTVQQLESRRDGVIQFSNIYAESIGAGSTTYNKIKGISPPPTRVSTINLTDIQIMSALNDVVIAYDQSIVAARSLFSTIGNDYFKYYVNYAINNGINLQQDQSKFLIPFPTNASLESLAVSYLGNIDRWPEIAAMNGLQEPYVDENGYFIAFKGNGSGNTILVSDPQKLYIGAVVFVSSDTQIPKQFQLAQINIINENDTILVFQDGDDLSPYTSQDNAKIQAFLPNTVNSQKLIAIPSSAAPTNAQRINIGPGVQDLNGLAQLSQTDLLLNSEGDWIITSGGDILRAQGYTNLAQAARIKLLTQQGSMLNHPTFGNPVQAGMSVADINLPTVISSLSNTFSQDPRFTGILAGQAVLKGPAVFFNLLIGVQGVNVNLPVTTLVPVQ